MPFASFPASSSAPRLRLPANEQRRQDCRANGRQTDRQSVRRSRTHKQQVPEQQQQKIYTRACKRHRKPPLRKPLRRKKTSKERRQCAVRILPCPIAPPSTSAAMTAVNANMQTKSDALPIAICTDALRAAFFFPMRSPSFATTYVQAILFIPARIFSIVYRNHNSQAAPYKLFTLSTEFCTSENYPVYKQNFYFWKDIGRSKNEELRRIKVRN